MKRKPATRRTKGPKKAARKKQVLVGIKVTSPTRKQLAALKKAFAAKELARMGLSPGGPVTNEQLSLRRRRRRQR